MKIGPISLTVALYCQYKLRSTYSVV